MRVLFIGDIVGQQAVAWVAGRLPELRREHAADLVVANAENANHDPDRPQAAFGMSVAIAERLLGAGVDVVTSGNHAWDGDPDEVAAVLAMPRVLRPANVEDRPGKGMVTLEAGGERVTVINLATPDAIAGVTPIRDYWSGLDLALAGTVIVDLHADSAFGKHIVAHGLDGQVAAVIGTHTHEATLHPAILPGGTAFVADVGMTGPLGGQGITGAWFKSLWRGEDWRDWPPLALASGPLVLGAVLIEIEDGRATSIVRVE